MDRNAKPVQENLRCVPIPGKGELKSKIEELETMGVTVTVKVTKPTTSISNTVAVRKPNKLRLCQQRDILFAHVQYREVFISSC